jgi:branched-chain amino acid aminotransferase
MSGTAVEIVPIQSCDDRLVNDGRPGPITNKIRDTYFEAVRGKLPEYESWLTRV